MVKTGKPLGTMIIDLKLDDTAFKRGIQGAKQSTRYWMSEMKASMKVMDLAGDSTGKLQAKQEGLTKVIDSQKKELEALVQRYKDSYDEQGNATSKTADYAREVRNAEAKLAGFELQLKNVSTQIKLNNSFLINSGKSVETFGKKVSKQGEVVSKFGSTMMKAFTLPVGAAIGGTIKAAMDFESAFAGVRKTVDASEAEFKKLEKGFKNMSTQIPVSASELSKLGESAGQLGIKTPNIEGFVRVIADLGVATNLAGEEGAQMLAKFANITKMPQDQFDKLGSSIVDLGNHFSTTENDIMEMAMRLAGAGHQVGLSQADILGLSSALSSVGIEAEMGGSAISKVMINMKVATAMGLSQMEELASKTGMTRRELELMKSNDGKSFKALADSIGMTTAEMTKIMNASKDLEGFASIAGMTGQRFKQAFEKDAVGAIGAFINGLGTAEEKGTSAIELLDEMGISEVRLRDSLLRAGNAQELFAEAIGISNKAWGENTALTKEAETRYGTFESQLEIFKNKINVIGINLGGPFMAAMNQVLDIATPFLEKISKLSEQFMELPKSTQANIVKFSALALAIGPMTWIVGKITSGFGSMFTVLGGGMQTLGKFKNSSNFMLNTMPKISSGLKTVGKTIGTGLMSPLKSLGSLLTRFIPIPSFLTTIIGPLASLVNPVTLVIGAVAALAGGIFYLNKQTGSFGATFNLLKDTVMNFFSVVYTEYIQPAFTAIVEAFSNMLASIKKFWDENGAQFMQALSNFFEVAWNLIQPALGFWSGIFGATFKTIVNLVKVAWDTIKGIFSGVFTALGGMIKVFTGIMTGDWSKAWDGMKDIAKGGWNTIASGIEGFANAVLTVISGLASGMQKGIVGAINGVIKAVNWILDKFGLDGFDEWKVKEIKVGKVKLPKFATGSNGLPFDTLGVVNDQKGHNYEEMIIPKKGKPFIPKGRDVVLPMEKGTQIIPANLTKQYKDSLPHFKKGFFGNVWEGTKNTVGKLWGNIKEFTGDIWDYMSNPKELVQLAVNKFTNIPELPSFWLDMAHGAVKHTADKAVGFVKAKFEEMFDSGGDADTSETGMLGVMQYLSDIAKDVMAKFPGMVATSGYRHGDPYSHGKRQAIDIAYPSNMNGSSKYFDPANYVFNKFRDKVAYVITQGMVRDRKGMSGTGASGQWVRWPDNDHYDHLHINGAIALGEGGSGGSVGSGVERWRSTAARALQMTGQYSKSNLDKLLYQMKTESGGNPKAINNWDINAINGTPSKGLMQVIDPTFRAYAKAPYNKNIYDPLSNILASIRYALSRYGSLAAAYRGVGYENGGIITRQHLAMVGEGNKPEMIIPLTRKSRAVELMDKAKSMLGISDNTTVVNDNSQLEEIVKRLSNTVEKQGEMMIALLQLIANKEFNVSTDVLSKLMNTKQADEVSKLLYGLGGV